MASKIIFEDLQDEFRLSDEGDLYWRNNEEETSGFRTLVLAPSLEAFVAWLTDEADKLKDDTDGQS